jgi:amidohydrolase family protein
MPLDFPARESGPLALTHVTALPLDTERELADHTLVIDKGLIRALGPSSQVGTKGMRVIDASGRYVMPGLADMYTHYWDPADSPLYLAHGITTVRTVCVPFQLAMSRVAARGDFPSPRVATISPPIDGVDADGRTDMPRGVAMTDAAQAGRLVERFARVGYKQIKAFSLITPENLRALCRASPVPVTANCPNAMSFEEAVDAGVYCLDQLHNVARDHTHAEVAFWDRFDPVPGTRLDFGAIYRLAGFLADRQTWNVPTLVFHQRNALSPKEGMQDPALKYVTPSVIKDWEATLTRWTRRARMDDVAQWRRAQAERAKAFGEVLAIFHREGVPLLTGTDSLNPWNVPGESLHVEIANFVRAGMTPFQALRCATVNAAKFLRDGRGTLEAGERADVVLLRGNPLRDVRALDSVEAVAVNGYYLPRTELDRLLAQRASKPQRLPDTRLDTGLDSPEQRWTERIVGAEAGRITFRHSRLPDGTLLIEERHAAAVPRRHVERRNSRLVLEEDYTLRSCEYTIDSFAGRERGLISRKHGGYVIDAEGLDGWRARQVLTSGALLPSERLTVTLWPLVVRQIGTARLLDVDEGTLIVREAQLSDGELKVTRPTHVTQQRYEFAADGKFVRMQETMPLLWLRELLPA